MYTYIVTRHQTPTPLYCSLYDLFMRHLKRPFTTLNAFTYEWSQLLLTHLHPEQHDCWQIPLDIHVCTWVGSRYSSRRKRGQTFRLVEPRANFLLSCCLKDWRHISLGLEVCMYVCSRPVVPWGPWHPRHPQILVDTLYQPMVPIMPPQLYWHPRIFRPPHGPV